MKNRFRAWDGGSAARMYTSPEVMVCDGDIWIFDEDSGFNEWIVNNDISLMQSTGLKDKNGKEIFEGDILDYKGKKVLVTWHGSYASFIYEFVGESQKRNPEWNPLYLAYMKCEIIGNIWEDGELLDGENTEENRR